MKKKTVFSFVVSIMICAMLSGCANVAPADTAPEKEQEETAKKDEKKSKKKDKKKKDKDKEKDKKKGSKDDWESLGEEAGTESYNEDVYAPVFDEVQDVLANGYDPDKNYKYISTGLMERVNYPEGDDLGEAIGYYLHDMNGDGRDELLIGENAQYEYGGPNDVAFIYSGFTCKDDKPECFIEGWARNRQHYIGDGRFFNTGSSGAMNTEFGECHLDPDSGKLVWDDFYFSCEDAAKGGMAFFRNTIGSCEPGDSERLNISEDEFGDILGRYENKIGAIAWTPLGKKSNGGKHIVNTMTDDELIKIEKKLNEIGYYGFMRSTYSDPRDIDWNEVFYVGAGFDKGSLPEKVKKAYLKATGEDEIYTDITAVSGKDVEKYVKETTGYDYSEMRDPLDWVYLKDYDLYLNEHGDTNQSQISVSGGQKERNEYTMVYTGENGVEYCVTFADEGGKYRFIANLPKWMVEDPTNGGDIDQTTITDGMIIPDSDSRKLCEDDLKGLDKKELRIARNEIYARHGRKFSDKELQEHFNKMEWYFPSVEAKDFDESKLNDYELYNLDLIGKFEKKAK